MILPDLGQYEFVAVDTETTGLQFWKDRAFLMSVSTPDGQDFVLDLREPNQLLEAQEMLPRAKGLVGHNLKFDLHFLRELGIHPGGDAALHDTMVYAALLNEHLQAYDLGTLAERYTDYRKDDSIYQALADMFGGPATRKVQAPRFVDAPVEVISKYAKADTRATLGLLEFQLPELRRQELEVVRLLEMDLLPVLLDIERGGVRVDLDRAEQAMPQLTTEIEALQARLDTIAGFRYGVLSPKSAQMLFQPRRMDNGWWALVDGTITKATESGKAASIDANCLRAMRHPAAALILEIRNLTKIRDTFLAGHVLGSQHHGVVHTSFNQTRTAGEDGGGFGTGSGRLSSNAPNLQQISKRNKRAMEIVRKCFLPDEGCEWVSGDLAQIDFRFVAHYVNNPEILGRYRENPDMDFHTLVAEMTGLPRNPTNESRACAKTINLGLAFGMGQGRLAEEMGLPFTVEQRPDGSFAKYAGPEAKELFDRYHRAVPGVKALLERATQAAKDRGYIRTILGRRCRFPGGMGTHKAGPLIFQGGAAELNKSKLISLHRAQKALGVRLMLNVHDSVEFSNPLGNSPIPRLQEIFESQEGLVRLRVPIRSSWTTGETWYEASL